MTVDLSKAQVGDTVHFKDGGKAVVKEVWREGKYLFKGYEEHFYYYDKNGAYCPESHPLDIIRIEPAPFNWKTVKQGMAFKTQEDDIFIFECWYSQDPTKCFVIKHDLNLEAAIFNPHNLIRVPEFDQKEVK